MEDHSQEQRERLWRQKLSEAERAKLRDQPELELEARLTDGMRRLADVPVPSNFTARVLQAIELEESRSARSRFWRWNWHALLPRMAVGTALLLFTGLGIQQHELALRHAEMARNLSAVAKATTVIPSMDALENLDAIQRMSQSTHADNELLAALQ